MGLPTSNMDGSHDKDPFKDIKNEDELPMYTSHRRSDDVNFTEGVFSKKDFKIFDFKDPESANTP